MNYDIIKKEDVIYNHITIDSVINHLQLDITQSGDTALIDSLNAAIAYIEDYIGYSVNYKNVTIKLSKLNQSYDDETFSIPYEKNYTINYLSGDTQLITDYTYNIKNQIDFTLNDSYNNIEISYIAGYPEGYCPINIIRAILIKTADYYDIERTSYHVNLVKSNEVIERLLTSYKKQFII